jgi:hypothetical protein
LKYIQDEDERRLVTLPSQVKDVRQAAIWVGAGLQRHALMTIAQAVQALA